MIKLIKTQFFFIYKKIIGYNFKTFFEISHTIFFISQDKYLFFFVLNNIEHHIYH